MASLYTVEHQALHNILQLFPQHFQLYVYVQKERFRLVNEKFSFLTIGGVPATSDRGLDLCCMWL